MKPLHGRTCQNEAKLCNVNYVNSRRIQRSERFPLQMSLVIADGSSQMSLSVLSACQKKQMVPYRIESASPERQDKTLRELRIAITQDGVSINAKRAFDSPIKRFLVLWQNARQANCTMQTFREYKQKASASSRK